MDTILCESIRCSKEIKITGLLKHSNNINTHRKWNSHICKYNLSTELRKKYEKIKTINMLNKAKYAKLDKCISETVDYTQIFMTHAKKIISEYI